MSSECEKIRKPFYRMLLEIESKKIQNKRYFGTSITDLKAKFKLRNRCGVVHYRIFIWIFQILRNWSRSDERCSERKPEIECEVFRFIGRIKGR